jgi:hypothetical protein
MISIKQDISSSNILSAAAFAAISIVALLVSFMTASYLYARSTLIPYGVLLALSFILLELLIMVYYSTLSEFGDLLMKKSGKAIPNVPDTTKAEAEHDEGERQVEIYEQSVKVNHILTDEAREKLKNNVHDYLVVAGHLRTLYPALFQTCSSKAQMPAIRCYQSCRRLPSIAQKTGLHRLLHSHQTPPHQRLHQSVLLQRPLELVLARRLSFSLRWKVSQDSSPSCIWHSRCTCGF